MQAKQKQNAWGQKAIIVAGMRCDYAHWTKICIKARQPKKKAQEKYKKWNNSAPFAFSSDQPMLLCCLRLLAKMFCMFFRRLSQFACIATHMVVFNRFYIFLSVSVDDFVSPAPRRFCQNAGFVQRCPGHCIKAGIYINIYLYKYQVKSFYWCLFHGKRICYLYLLFVCLFNQSLTNWLQNSWMNEWMNACMDGCMFVCSWILCLLIYVL